MALGRVTACFLPSAFAMNAWGYGIRRTERTCRRSRSASWLHETIEAAIPSAPDCQCTRLQVLPIACQWGRRSKGPVEQGKAR